MKKQDCTARWLRIGALCLTLALLASLGISAAFAKFTYSASGKHEARVAKLNVVVKEGEGHPTFLAEENNHKKAGPTQYWAYAMYTKEFTVSNLSEVVVKSTAHITGVPRLGSVKVTKTYKNDKGEEISEVLTEGYGSKMAYSAEKKAFLNSDEGNDGVVDVELGQLPIGGEAKITLVMTTYTGTMVAPSRSWRDPAAIGGNSYYNQNLNCTFSVRSEQVD